MCWNDSARRASTPIHFQLAQQGGPVRQSTFSWLSKACQYANPISLTQQGVPVCQSSFSWLSKAYQYAIPLSADSARRASTPIHFQLTQQGVPVRQSSFIDSARRASTPIQFQLTQQGVSVRQSSFSWLSKACQFSIYWLFMERVLFLLTLVRTQHFLWRGPPFWNEVGWLNGWGGERIITKGG